MAYPLEWKGLDQGVEHTWKRDVIMGGLRTIAKHAPVKHRDENSPFYADMESLFPDKTWRAWDEKDGSFRPIFRRSNTWKKLGLIVERDKEFTLSLAGSQLLANEISLSDVYSSVFRNHIEGSEKPFVILASLLTALNSQEIDIDFILHVLHHWRPGDDINDAVNKTKTETFDKNSNENKTRKRRIKSMLKLFVSMGCVTFGKNKVQITSKSLLSDIGELSELEDSFYDELETSQDEVDVSGEKRKTKPSSTPRKRTSSKNEIKQFTYDAAQATDPTVRLRLLERAKQGHEDTVSLAAGYFETKGHESFEHPFSYDLHTPISDEYGYLLEIKTINASNFFKQIREAVSQLHEYNFRFKESLSSVNHLVIVVDQNPMEFIEEDSWVFDYLENDRDILLMWFSEGEPNTTSHSKERLEQLKAA